MWIEVLIIFVVIYLILSVFVYFLANSNLIPSRRHHEYTIRFRAELKHIPSVLNSDKQVAYWVALQENDQSKNVILLHGFTRTSDKLQSRGEIYWKLGYNLYFVDNLGHGYSSDLLYPSGYRYYKEVINIIDHENLGNPIVHGLSMGAIAASMVAQLHPDLPKAVVCEALARHFDDLYPSLFRYLKIPYQLFPWIDWVSLKLNWKQFEELGLDLDDYNPTTMSCPVFLLHSDNDKLFNYREHFLPMVDAYRDKEDFYSWLVPQANHTNMDRHPEYAHRLKEFLGTVENS